MVVRIVQILIGLGLSGGGGYLIFQNRAQLGALWPVSAEAPPWLLIGGIAGVFLGLIFLLTGILPSPPKKKDVEAKAAANEEKIKQADVFYSERAKSKDSDWRSGDLPPKPQPTPQPAPQPAPVRPATVVAPKAAPPPPQPSPQPQPQAQAPKPAPQPELAMPAPARPAQVKPQASATPPPQQPSAFPSAATLSPIPRAADPPAQPVPPKTATPPPASKPAPASSGSSAKTFDAIRKALSAKKFDEAEKALNEERDRLQALGPNADKAAVAELTGLAGDHAAATGKPNAKFLWNLALKRFADAGATSSPAARAIAERLKDEG